MTGPAKCGLRAGNEQAGANKRTDVVDKDREVPDLADMKVVLASLLKALCLVLIIAVGMGGLASASALHGDEAHCVDADLVGSGAARSHLLAGDMQSSQQMPGSGGCAQHSCAAIVEALEQTGLNQGQPSVMQTARDDLWLASRRGENLDRPPIA